MFSGVKTDFKTIIINILPQLFNKSTSDVVDWQWAMTLLKYNQLPDIHRRLGDTECDQILMDVSLKQNGRWLDPSLLAADRSGEDYGTSDANQTLIDIFDQKGIEGKLLIFGETGLGKTTALLRLAEKLVSREISKLSLAEQSVSREISKSEHFIPVIFELSKWQNDQDIDKWLIDQLYDRYKRDRRSNIYEQWLEHKVLLPLMDGLDELGLEQQRKCTKKLNKFAKDYTCLVVCCGVNQFVNADINLEGIRGAVCLQPLSDSQIQNYFTSVERPNLWVEIENSPLLKAMLELSLEGNPGLLRVPLFVKLIVNVNVSDPKQPISNKADLLDKYITQQLSDDNRKSDRINKQDKSNWSYKAVKNEPDCKDTRKHLLWIAQNLQNNTEIDFFIERLQPSCISSELEHYYLRFYWIIFLIFTLLIVMFGLTIIVLTNQEIFNKINIIAMLWEILDPGSLLLLITTLLLSRLIIWLVRGRKQASWLTTEAYKIDRIESVEDFQFLSNENLFNPIRFKFLLKILVSLVIFSSIVWVCDISIYMYRIFPFILAATILNCITYGVNLLKQELNLKNRENPNQGIINSFNNYIKLTILIVVIYVISVFFGSQLPSIFLPVGLIVSFLVCGGKAWVQHLSLRIVLWWKSGLPWNFAQFLNYCVERRLLLRVGGSYRFLHSELLDHFAQSDD
jgi:hypothetical protein